MPSVEDHIASLTQAAQGLTTTVANKIEDIDNRVDDATAQVDQYILEQSPAIPQMNLAANSGRFTTPPHPYSVASSSGFVLDPSFDVNYNSSTVADAGKFIHGNATNGGTGAPLNQVVIDLLNAMGRTELNARFGAEFHVAEFTKGPGTNATPTRPNFYLIINNLFAVMGVDGWGTSANWVRAVDGEIDMGHVVRVNGEPHSGLFTLHPSDGWVHVLRHYRRHYPGYGYAHTQPFAEVGTKLQLALPVLLPGRHLFPPHDGPVASNTTYAPPAP